MARILITDETRQRLQERDPRWRSKCTMRAIATFLDFIGMILFVVSVTMTIHWENVWNEGIGGDWTDGMPLAPILISLFYNPIVLFLLLRHRCGRLYHPGWDVGFDLLIWALRYIFSDSIYASLDSLMNAHPRMEMLISNSPTSVPSIVFSVGDGWFWWWQPVEIEFGDLIPCNNRFNFWSQACQPTIYTIGKIEMAANVFLGLILIIHFILFVMACIATHKWRREAKKAKTERRNIELQYHRSPEQHTAKQFQGYQPRDSDKDLEADYGAATAKQPPGYQATDKNKDLEADYSVGSLKDIEANTPATAARPA